MNNYFISPIYTRNKEIQNFISNLIIDSGYKCYGDFDITDKKILSAHLSKIASESDELEFMVQGDSHFLIDAFRTYMCTNKDRDANYFMEHMENSFISYYESTMEKLFNYYLDTILENAA